MALFSAAGLPNLIFRCLTASPSSHGRHAGLPTLARPRRVPIGAKQAHPPLLTQGKGAAPCDRGYTRKNLKFPYLCQQYDFGASCQLYHGPDMISSLSGDRMSRLRLSMRACKFIFEPKRLRCTSWAAVAGVPTTQIPPVGPLSPV